MYYLPKVTTLACNGVIHLMSLYLPTIDIVEVSQWQGIRGVISKEIRCYYGAMKINEDIVK